MLEEKLPYYLSHRAMNKKVTYRFLFCLAKYTSISQFPVPTLKMIKGYNFIQKGVPNEKQYFGRDIWILNCSIRNHKFYRMKRLNIE